MPTVWLKEWARPRHGASLPWRVKVPDTFREVTSCFPFLKNGPNGTKGGKMEFRRKVMGWCSLVLLGFTFVPMNSSADVNHLRRAVAEIRRIPFNPRPYLLTEEVTGISFQDARADFISTFQRVTFCSPANGKTYAPGNNLTGACTDPDALLVGYLHLQSEPYRPGILITHGGAGPTLNAFTGALVFGTSTPSIAFGFEAPIGLARAFAANGYHVLIFDRQDGLLTVCSRNQADPGTTPGHPCNALPLGFRNDIPQTFAPQTRGSDLGAHGEGNVIAAASFLKNQVGEAVPIGALGGSLSGQILILTAARQHIGGFSPDLDARVQAFLVLSPVASQDHRTGEATVIDPLCFRRRAAGAYSEVDRTVDVITPVPGTGIGLVSPIDISGIQDLLDLTRASDEIKETKDPILILNTLNDDDTTPEEGLAYLSRTARLPNAETLTLIQGGHFNLLWRSDPFFVTKAALEFFKELLAPNNSGVTTNPGFKSPGPNEGDPFLTRLNPLPKSKAANILFRNTTEDLEQLIKANCF